MVDRLCVLKADSLMLPEPSSDTKKSAKAISS